MTHPDDPYHPDWRPEYNPHHGLGNVGTGDAFAADLYELYAAGRVLLPDVAENYSWLAAAMRTLYEPMRDVLEFDGYSEFAQRLLLRFRGDLQHTFRQTASNLEATGSALVQLAALFATTDQEAAGAFADLLDENWADLEPTSAGTSPEGVSIKSDYFGDSFSGRDTGFGLDIHLRHTNLYLYLRTSGTAREADAPRAREMLRELAWLVVNETMRHVPGIEPN